MDLPETPYNIKLKTVGGKYIWSDIHLLGGWRIQKNFWTDHYRLLDAKDYRRAWSSYDHCLARLQHYRKKYDLCFQTDHLVILLHGLGRHGRTMKKPCDALRQAGFDAHCLNYASTFQTVEKNADDIQILLGRLEGIKRVSFVGHSLGGLVAREILSRAPGKVKPHRLVTLGTPNQGARIADVFSPLKPYQIIAGPSGQDVRPFRAAKLPPPPIPTLVIAGGRGGAGYNPLLGEDNDGIVTVEETKIDGMTKFIRLPVIHTLIMNHKDAIKAMIGFVSED